MYLPRQSIALTEGSDDVEYYYTPTNGRIKMKYDIRLKRIYEPKVEDDGYRVLVDRLWPRGISKEKASIDFWAKEISPSNELRKEYHANPDDFLGFYNSFREELEINESLDEFISMVKEKLEVNNVTFLYASKDMDKNHASILKEWVENNDN